MSHWLVPSKIHVRDNNASKADDATESNSEMDMTDDDDVAQELRDDSSLRDEAEKETPLPANNSILGDFSVLRDFFLAAFSDGCYKVRFASHTCDEQMTFTLLN